MPKKHKRKSQTSPNDLIVKSTELFKELELNKSEPVYESRGYNLNNDNGVLFRQSKTLSMNRSYKNNMINPGADEHNHENIFINSRKLKQTPLENIIDMPREKFEEKIGDNSEVIEEDKVEDKLNSSDNIENNSDKVEDNSEIIPQVIPTIFPITSSDIIDGIPMYNSVHINKKLYRTCYVIIIICLVVFSIMLMVLTSFRKYLQTHTQTIHTNNPDIIPNMSGTIPSNDPNNSDITQNYSERHHEDVLSNSETISNINPEQSTTIGGDVLKEISQNLPKSIPRDAHGRFMKR